MSTDSEPELKETGNNLYPKWREINLKLKLICKSILITAHFNLQALLLISVWRLPALKSVVLFLGGGGIPDNKVMRVNLRSTAAVQQDARVSHNGTAPVMLVLHGGHSWQKTVEVLWDVCGAVAIKYIVDDISWFQCALQNRDVSLWIKKSQNILPLK